MKPNLATLHAEFIFLKETLRKHPLTQGVFDLLEKVDRDFQEFALKLHEEKQNAEDTAKIQKKFEYRQCLEGRARFIEAILGGGAEKEAHP